MNQDTGTTQTATVTVERSYRQNWLRDPDEPWLYSNDVEGLRTVVTYFCGEHNARTLQRLIDAADVAACQQSGCDHAFNIPCWQHETLIGFMCPKCGLRRALLPTPARQSENTKRREQALLIQGRIWQIDTELEGGAPTREELKRELQALNDAMNAAEDVPLPAPPVTPERTKP